MKEKKVQLSFILMLLVYIGLPLMFINLQLFGEYAGFNYVIVSIVTITLSSFATSYYIGHTNNIYMFIGFVLYLFILQCISNAMTYSSLSLIYFKEHIFYLLVAAAGIFIGLRNSKLD